MSPVEPEKEDKDVSFFREAFFNGYNLAVLGASAALGLFHWDLLPLIGGLLLPLEALYLLVVPDQAWFQRWVKLQKALELKEVDEKKKKQVIASFSPELQKRYQRMVRMKEDIEQKCSSSEMGNMIGAEELVKLNGYLDSFVYFMEFRAQCMATKLSIDVGEIEGRIRRLEMEVKNDEEVPERKQVNSLRQETIKMSREILDRFQRLDSYIAMVDAQAEAIENALKLLQVRLATSNFQAEGEVELVSSDMNNLLASIHSTEKSIEEASKDMIKIKKLSRLSIP